MTTPPCAANPAIAARLQPTLLVRWAGHGGPRDPAVASVQWLSHRSDHEGQSDSGVPAQGTCTPSVHAHVRRTQNHWSERGRATSVANADALGRPRRSVLALGRVTL